MTHYAETNYGFEWGPVTVTRIASDDRLGFVLRIETPHATMDVRATPKGRELQAYQHGKKLR